MTLVHKDGKIPSDTTVNCSLVSLEGVKEDKGTVPDEGLLVTVGELKGRMKLLCHASDKGSEKKLLARWQFYLYPAGMLKMPV